MFILSCTTVLGPLICISSQLTVVNIYGTLPIFFYSISLSKYAEGPKYPACILNLLFVNLKGPLHEIFYPRPLIHGLIPF
jgi:hypothetical protein